jgi:hypothetical protein
LARAIAPVTMGVLYDSGENFSNFPDSPDFHMPYVISSFLNILVVIIISFVVVEEISSSKLSEIEEYIPLTTLNSEETQE